MITTKELVERTGVNYRMIDYWARNSVIFPDKDKGGSGNHRGWDEGTVPMIRTLGLLQAGLSTGHSRGALTTAMLARIADNYGYGELDLGNGCKLTWEVEFMESRWPSRAGEGTHDPHQEEET